MLKISCTYLLLLFGVKFGFAQQLEVSIKNEVPYYVGQDILVEVYMTNNTDDTLRYFDSRGPAWESFKELWQLSINDRFVETPSRNLAYDKKFTDSTFISLPPNETQLVRFKTLNLEIPGRYSLSYNQSQGANLVNRNLGDTTVTDSAINRLNTFKLTDNLQFRVFQQYDTAVTELINFTWDEWKEHRPVKLHSRKQHFTNIYDAHKNPQDVYSLDIYCNGLSAEDIIRLGRFKNMRALHLYNYHLDYFPKELAELDLYELTIMPKGEQVVSFEEGLSMNNTIRELKAKFMGGLPKEVLLLEHLISLDIGDCDLNVVPSLSELKNLEVLELNNAGLQTLHDMELSSLPKLKDVNFSGNRKINDISPLLTCYNLEFLVINRTSITEVPYEIVQLNKLKKLSISSKITSVTDSIYLLDDMRYLSFGGNTKLDSIPVGILQMKKLHHLDISRTNIKELPEGISELPLEKVILTHSACEVTKDYKELKKQLGKNFKD